MSEVRSNAMNFEAVKVSMQQNKDGVMLRLAVHPNEQMMFQFSMHDAIGQACAQDPPYTIQLTPEPSGMTFIGSLSAPLVGANATAAMVGAKSIKLLQASAKQAFNLTVSTPAITSASFNHVIQFKTIPCAPG